MSQFEWSSISRRWVRWQGPGLLDFWSCFSWCHCLGPVCLWERGKWVWRCERMYFMVPLKILVSNGNHPPSSSVCSLGESHRVFPFDRGELSKRALRCRGSEIPGLFQQLSRSCVVTNLTSAHTILMWFAVRAVLSGEANRQISLR